MYAKITNEETKQCEVGIGTNTEFYKSIGMTEMEVEQAYNGSWYVKEYVPEKPEAITNAERVAELKQKLSETDYIWNVIKEGDADEEHYADVIANRKAWRAEVRSLENSLDSEE